MPHLGRDLHTYRKGICFAHSSQMSLAQRRRGHKSHSFGDYTLLKAYDLPWMDSRAVDLGKLTTQSTHSVPLVSTLQAGRFTAGVLPAGLIADGPS